MKREPQIGDIVGHVYEGSSVEFRCSDCGIVLVAEYMDASDCPIRRTASGISLNLGRFVVRRGGFLAVACKHEAYSVTTNQRLRPVRYGPYEAAANRAYRAEQRRLEGQMHARAFA